MRYWILTFKNIDLPIAGLMECVTAQCGKTPLRLAREKSQKPMLGLLLRRGASVEVVDVVRTQFHFSRELFVVFCNAKMWSWFGVTSDLMISGAIVEWKYSLKHFGWDTGGFKWLQECLEAFTYILGMLVDRAAWFIGVCRCCMDWCIWLTSLNEGFLHLISAHFFWKLQTIM